MRKKVKIFILLTFTIILLFATFIYAMKNGKVIFNTTSSFPLGFYKISKSNQYKKGDLVSFCAVPSKMIDRMIKQGYSQKNSLCPNQTPQLLKKILGLEGDNITMNSVVLVNNQPIKNSRVFKKDRNGNLLNFQQSQRVKKDYFWAMSDYNEKSFDSRYFGQIPLENIIGRATPIMTWD
ncbi:conjugative transfer signal peptidase TraF [Sulfurovum sp. bin170]|uniref:conjugative transfer signal peptidase TraF n=1 Tax=Sulfurovum sp. bin170 TaxID=2695268 RepID=UPI0013E0158E|nr:conjugative transfer signal peptidase TraF [Sulfurovum sp. bin170]NEW59903.1 conjugative transfer signal peptidase TraF [Sulfurovum sp. bin170]